MFQCEEIAHINILITHLPDSEPRAQMEENKAWKHKSYRAEDKLWQKKSVRKLGAKMFYREVFNYRVYSAGFYTRHTAGINKQSPGRGTTVTTTWFQAMGKVQVLFDHGHTVASEQESLEFEWTEFSVQRRVSWKENCLKVWMCLWVVTNCRF